MKLTGQNAVIVIIIVILVGIIGKELIPKNGSSSSKNTSSSEQTVVAEKEIPDVKKADKIIVANFHGTQRCVSCTALGKLAEKTVTERFADEIASGKMEFKSINGELPENEEIVNLYQASGSSLYINAIKDGKNNIVQNMKVWKYLNDEPGFTTYLETQLKSLL